MKDETKQILFLVLISIFIIVLIVTITILIKNKELITQDAITYGLKNNNFTSCSCLDQKGNYINYFNK